MSDTPDRRTERTSSALWAALLDLLREADWHEIGVQGIADRANVGRSTFYAHFPTKQALLDWGFARQGAEIRAEVVAGAGRMPEGQLATVAWLVDHMAGSRGFLRRLAASPSGYVIQDRFRRALRDVLGAELAGRGLAVDPQKLAFLNGGLFAVLEDGVIRGERPEVLKGTLSALVLAGV